MPKQHPATSLTPDHYMVGTAQEFWEESNGHAGLQRVYTSCPGQAAIPPDTCITHRENGALVACLATYTLSLVD